MNYKILHTIQEEDTKKNHTVPTDTAEATAAVDLTIAAKDQVTTKALMMIATIVTEIMDTTLTTPHIVDRIWALTAPNLTAFSVAMAKAMVKAMVKAMAILAHSLLKTVWHK